MIFDLQSLFSNDQAIIADAISTNVIDLGVRGTPYAAAAALNGDVGKGTMIPILIQVTEAFNTLTSLTITIETGANADLSSSTVVHTEVLLLAALTLGKQLYISVLPKGLTGRYLGIRYNVTGTDPTLGKIMAGVTMGNQTNFTGA
jgi:hypothetical protein